MKLAQIEETMENGHFSEALFAQFQTALKRVPKPLRCQHCYTTAYSLGKKDPKNAIRLIQYGLETFQTDWVDRMRAHHNLGSIYEGCGQYEQAEAAYRCALACVPQAQQEDYLPELSSDILRAHLHVSGFAYTDCTRQLLAAVAMANEFTAQFRHVMFYRAAAQLVVARHDADPAAEKAAYNAAMLALNEEAPTLMDRVLRRHRYKNEAHATKQALAFLRKNRR